MSTHDDRKKAPPTEDDVLRRMLNTPPKQHDAKPAPAKKTPEKKP